MIWDHVVVDDGTIILTKVRRWHHRLMTPPGAPEYEVLTVDAEWPSHAPGPRHEQTVFVEMDPKTSFTALLEGIVTAAELDAISGLYIVKVWCRVPSTS